MWNTNVPQKVKKTSSIPPFPSKHLLNKQESPKTKEKYNWLPDNLNTTLRGQNNHSIDVYW